MESKRIRVPPSGVGRGTSEGNVCGPKLDPKIATIEPGAMGPVENPALVTIPPALITGAFGLSGTTLAMVKPPTLIPPPELARNSLVAPAGTVKLFTAPRPVSPLP